MPLPAELGDQCACEVHPDLPGKSWVWRPCPYKLCDRPDHFHNAELAWAAGFFDGEGWTSGNVLQGGRTNAFFLGLSQKDPRPLARFLAAVGHEDRPIYANRLNTVAWTGAKALTILRRLWPYLSEPKREQAGRALSLAHFTRSRRYPKLNAIYDDAYAWLLEQGYVPKPEEDEEAEFPERA